MPASPYADDDHLPQKRGDRPQLDPRTLPRQRRGAAPGGHSRYPEQDVMAQQDAWDEPTRALLVDRVERPPPLRFFTPDEAVCIGAFLDEFLGQDDEPRVPALAFLDARLHEGRTDGYRHASLPPDPELWRTLGRAFDEAARSQGAASFAAAPAELRESLVGTFSDGRLHAPAALAGIDQGLAWQIAAGHMVEAFWSHPWAWNEMGFPGPAYPRGYVRLGPDEREHWEAFEEGPPRGPQTA
jgi:hypothetical protein